MPILRAHDEKTPLMRSVHMRLLENRCRGGCGVQLTSGIVTPPIEIGDGETRTCLLLSNGQVQPFLSYRDLHVHREYSALQKRKYMYKMIALASYIRGMFAIFGIAL